MDSLFEQNIVQNDVLAAEAIWEAVNECFKANEKRYGPELPLIFFVLPIVFHHDSVESLYSKKSPGALSNAVTGDRLFTLGLQERMEALADKTWKGLNLAIQAGLINIEMNGSIRLSSGRATSPFDHSSEEVKHIVAAAKRVGQAFHELNKEQLCMLLKVCF